MTTRRRFPLSFFGLLFLLDYGRASSSIRIGWLSTIMSPPTFVYADACHLLRVIERQNLMPPTICRSEKYFFDYYYYKRIFTARQSLLFVSSPPTTTTNSERITIQKTYLLKVVVVVVLVNPWKSNKILGRLNADIL